MFEGFEDVRVPVGGDLSLRVRYAGQGPAILLIHGHPRTGSTWYRVAPLLKDLGYRVIVPDMRGYGESSAPTVLSDHTQQSKRQVAYDLKVMMDWLGEERYTVVGHDRGCYVGFRMALDHPQSVLRFMALDAVPISDALDRCDWKFAREWFHWFFFAQEEKPEAAILPDPISWYDEDAAAMGAENYEEFCRAVSDPTTVIAMLEDYRAGLGVDYELEKVDRFKGSRIACPVRVIWAAREDLHSLYADPIAIWKEWCQSEVTGTPLDSGHHLAEDAPEDLVSEIAGFCRGE